LSIFVSDSMSLSIGVVGAKNDKKNGENFGVFGPPDPQKCDFRRMDFNLHWPHLFSMLKPNFMEIR